MSGALDSVLVFVDLDGLVAFEYGFDLFATDVTSQHLVREGRAIEASIARSEAVPSVDDETYEWFREHAEVVVGWMHG